MTTNSWPFLKRYVSLWRYYDYGAYLIKNLAKQLEPEYGSRFSVRQLERCRPILHCERTAFAIKLDAIQVTDCHQHPTRNPMKHSGIL